ncbi:MAG TPA: rod-binding protein [Burkholderiales bacterium]|nr:rod-binding protein [Burkholderiales bacterium]
MTVPPLLAGLAADPKALGDLKRHAVTDEPSALREAAKQFETLLLDLTMKSMRATVPGDGVFDNEGTQLFTDLLDQQFAQGVTRQGGLGLAELLVRQLSQLRGLRDQEKAGSVDTFSSGESR